MNTSGGCQFKLEQFEFLEATLETLVPFEIS